MHNSMYIKTVFTQITVFMLLWERIDVHITYDNNFKIMTVSVSLRHIVRKISEGKK